MQNHLKKVLIIGLTGILLILAAIPALAVENSLDFGYVAIPTVEYERRFSESVTGFISGSYSNNDEVGMWPLPFYSGEVMAANLGVKCYLSGRGLNGFYLGLGTGWYRLDGEAGFLFPDNVYTEGCIGWRFLVGYKKAFDSGFTLEAGGIVDRLNGANDYGIGFNLKLGYSW